MKFKHKKFIYFSLVIIGVAGIATGLLTGDGFFLFGGFVFFAVSWPFDTIFLKCDKCGVTFRFAFEHAVLSKYRGVNYLLHLMKIKQCENPKCKHDLE